MKYKFELKGFDHALNGATQAEKSQIEKIVESCEVDAADEVEAYEKFERVLGGQELMVFDDYAYIEIFKYSQAVYVRIV